MTQKTVEELDAEIEQLQQKKKEMLAAVPPPRRAGFYPDYEYGNIKSLHQHVVSFALGEASELRLQAYDARQTTTSYSEDVATPCTKEWFNDATRVRVSWLSRGRTQHCVWLVDAASKHVYSYYHNNTQRFYEKAPETTVAEAAPEPVAAVAAPVAEPSTVVAVADPPKVPAITTLRENIPSCVAYAAAQEAYREKDNYAMLQRMDGEWREAVGAGAKVGKIDLRPNATNSSITPQRARPSPWHEICHAMRRNETCVLYCKHKDDGWTPELWQAACTHLTQNGVMVGMQVERCGLRYYDLFWEFKA